MKALRDIILILSCLITFQLQAQEATPEVIVTSNNPINSFYTASTTEVLIGEPIELTLNIEAPNNITITNFPTLPEDAEPFFVKETHEVKEVTQGDTTTYTQDSEIVLWETGLFNTPEVFVRFVNPATGAEASSPVRSVAFNVTSVLDISDQNLRPAKSLIYLTYIPPWLIVGIVAIVGGILFGLYYLQKNRQKLSAAFQPGTPVQVAVMGLENLREQYLPAIQTYPLVADHLRTYIQGRFQIRAQDMTTSELINQIHKEKILTEKLRSSLQSCLEQADLVKFARFEPGANASEQFIHYAITWLQAAEKAHD